MRFAEKVCAQARAASPAHEGRPVPAAFFGKLKYSIPVSLGCSSPPSATFLVCWSAQVPACVSGKSDDLKGSDPFFSERKMLERFAWILLAWVLAFAFAPYFYALGGL
jgi:hypothetical protein